MIQTEVKVTRTILAGGRVWSAGLYPTAKDEDIQALLRVAKQETEAGVKQPNVIIVKLGDEIVEDAGELIEASEVINDSVSINESDIEVEEVVELTNDEVVTESDVETSEESLSVDEFNELNANQQKKYLNQLADNEDLSYERFYSLVSDYQQVATAKSVMELIEDLLAGAEEEE